MRTQIYWCIVLTVIGLSTVVGAVISIMSGSPTWWFVVLLLGVIIVATWVDFTGPPIDYGL